MRPPILEIRLIMQAPHFSWGYLAKVRGESIAEEEGFAKPGEAFSAAMQKVKAFIATHEADE